MIRLLALGLVALLAACQSGGQAKPSATAARPAAAQERWQVVPRGDNNVAAVVNASGYTLSLGCGGTGSSGRYMEVLSGGRLVGDPPEYAFRIQRAGQALFMDAVELAPVRRDDGSSVVYATLSAEAVEVLRRGNAIEVSVPGVGAQRFSLAGSKAAINSSSCGV